MSFSELRRAIIAANKTPIAMEDSRAEALVIAGTAIARGERVNDSALAQAVSPHFAEDSKQARGMAAGYASPTMMPAGKGMKTAVVSFRGLVTYDCEFQPFAVSTRNFAHQIRDLTLDDSVRSIVIMMDSPGGTVFGLPEAADAVWEARQTKNVLAAVDVLCASAAFYVASQATEISLMPSGAGAGSIGVRMMHCDCSQMLEGAGMKFTHIYSGDYKIEGNPYEPLSEDAKARYQYECDTLYGQFVATVARGRGISTDRVLKTFGQGRVLMPSEALRVGMVDRLASQEDAASDFIAAGSRFSRTAAMIDLEKRRLMLDLIAK